MALSESALDVESALDLGIGPRLGTNPRSESYIYITDVSRLQIRDIEPVPGSFLAIIAFNLVWVFACIISM